MKRWPPFRRISCVGSLYVRLYSPTSIICIHTGDTSCERNVLCHLLRLPPTACSRSVAASLSLDLNVHFLGSTSGHRKRHRRYKRRAGSGGRTPETQPRENNKLWWKERLDDCCAKRMAGSVSSWMLESMNERGELWSGRWECATAKVEGRVALNARTCKTVDTEELGVPMERTMSLTRSLGTMEVDAGDSR